MDHKPPPVWVAVLAGVAVAAALAGSLFLVLTVTGGVRQQVIVVAKLPGVSAPAVVASLHDHAR